MSRELISAVRNLSGVNRDQVTIVSGEVVSVNESKRTCIITTTGGRDSVQIENVQLMASVDDGLLVIPSVGSTVLVAYSTYNIPFVALFSSIDKVVIIVGASQLSIVDGQVMINDGSFGGLVEVAALVTKLNNLENLVNDLSTKFNGHTHVLTLSSGSGTAAPTSTTETTTLTPTQRGDIENTKISHGI